jgi:hypothetical protein
MVVCVEVDEYCRTRDFNGWDNMQCNVVVNVVGVVTPSA